MYIPFYLLFTVLIRCVFLKLKIIFFYMIISLVEILGNFQEHFSKIKIRATELNECFIRI